MYGETFYGHHLAQHKLQRTIMADLPLCCPMDLKYRKVPKFSDAKKLCCNLPKIQTKRPNLRVFHQKDAYEIANSEDPDMTAPLGAVLSGSALFAQTCLSENLRSLR